jgi:hypothetical protein
MVRALAAVLLAGCTMITGVEVPEQTLTAACGMCIFKQPPVAGCYWAIEYEGSYYAVNGPVPKDHDSHGPEGMCTMPRRAVVAGTIRGEQIFATKFELLPADPSLTPAVAPAHDHAH